MTVSAAGKGSVAVSDATVPAGGATATIDLSLTTNPGVMAMSISPTAPNGITLKLNGTGIGGNWTIGKDAIWDNDSNSTYTGVFMNVEVTVDSTIPAGTYTIDFAVHGVNYDEEDVEFNTATATITVTCNHNFDQNQICTECGQTQGEIDTIVEDVPQEAPANNSGFPWWIILLVVVAGISAVLVIRKKKF